MSARSGASSPANCNPCRCLRHDVRLKIILPRFSPPGQYLIAVTRDQSGNGVMAEGSAAALASGDKETVAVDLDLRKAKSGQYFLSTTHEQDHASYYYPLQIK